MEDSHSYFHVCTYIKFKSLILSLNFNIFDILYNLVVDSR